MECCKGAGGTRWSGATAGPGYNPPLPHSQPHTAPDSSTQMGPHSHHHVTGRRLHFDIFLCVFSACSAVRQQLEWRSRSCVLTPTDRTSGTYQYHELHAPMGIILCNSMCNITVYRWSLPISAPARGSRRFLYSCWPAVRSRRESQRNGGPLVELICLILTGAVAQRPAPQQ